MSRIDTEPKHRGSRTPALLVIALACLGLGACGSSSNGTSASPTSSGSSTPATTQAASSGATTPSTTPTSTPTSTTPTIRTGSQLKHFYDCLVRAGIKLPPLNELGKAKIDTTSPHYQAVLKKCERELHL